MNNDNRKAPWLLSRNRNKTFEVFVELAQNGLSRRQIAIHLGTSLAAIRSYFWRYGITMEELKGQSHES